MIFEKIRKYGLSQSFFRGLLRFISKFDFHPYYLYRKYFFGNFLKEINGVKMLLDLKNDDGISRFLMIYGKREPITVDYLIGSKILKEGDMVLDIGANIGYYALLESKMIGSSGCVYAVEPIKNNLKILRENIRINGFSNVKTYNLAMGDVNKNKVEIYKRTKGNLSSFTPLSSDYGEVVSVEEVCLSTVDAFVEIEMNTPPKFIRMDVEGYEANILKGMKRTLKSKPHLQIEFHPTILTKEQKNNIRDLLKKNGYSKVVITANPKPRLNAIIRWLNDKIRETYNESGELSQGDIDWLYHQISLSPRIFNAFIS